MWYVFWFHRQHVTSTALHLPSFSYVARGGILKPTIMQHIWNKETDTCERCGLVRATKKRKVLINPRYESTYDQYYTVYYKSGILLQSMPRCYDPKQIKLNL